MCVVRINQKIYGETRDHVIQRLQDNRVEVRPLWHLNHLQKPYRTAQNYQIERAYEMLEMTLNLPCGVGLTEDDVMRIAKILKKRKS